MEIPDFLNIYNRDIAHSLLWQSQEIPMTGLKLKPIEWIITVRRCGNCYDLVLVNIKEDRELILYNEPIEYNEEDPLFKNPKIFWEVMKMDKTEYNGG